MDLESVRMTLIDDSLEKGARFCLQVFPDEAERSERAQQKGKLIDLSDLDQMMKQPLDLPSRSLLNRPLSPTKRTSSVTSVSSMDASVALDSVISQVGSSSMGTAIQAVVQVCTTTVNILYWVKRNGNLTP